MSNINWGLLQPTQAQNVGPHTQVVAMPNNNGSNGLSGTLGGVKGLLNGLFGTNPVQTVNNALQGSLASTPSPSITQGLIGATTPQNMPSRIQQAAPNLNPQGPLSASPLSIENIQRMAEKQFPNNPTMQQIAVAQATQESGLLGGHPSQLASKYNNLYGMKALPNQASVSLPTMENINGKDIKTNANFAAYNTPQQSMQAYANLMNSPRYQGVTKASSFEEAAKALQKAGYATDPNYAENLMSVNKLANEGHNSAAMYRAHTFPSAILPGSTPVPDTQKQSPAYQQGAASWTAAVKSGLTTSPYMVSVDFSKPASSKRLSVVNMQTGRVVMQSEVAEGNGFSNKPGSHGSETGNFITQQTYDGKNGYSLRVNGIDKGINDNASARDIVVHGADYVGDGKTGHSFGCFAVPQKNAPALINLIKQGTLINAYKEPSTTQNQQYAQN